MMDCVSLIGQQQVLRSAISDLPDGRVNDSLDFPVVVVVLAAAKGVDVLQQEEVLRR